MSIAKDLFFFLSPIVAGQTASFRVVVIGLFLMEWIFFLLEVRMQALHTVVRPVCESGSLIDLLLTHSSTWSVTAAPRSTCCSSCTIKPVSCMSGAALARSPVGCRFAYKARVFLLSLVFKLAELGVRASLRLAKRLCPRGRALRALCRQVGLVPSVHVATFCRTVTSTNGGF